MEFPEALVAVIGTVMSFSMLITWITYGHQRKMAELKLKLQAGAGNSTSEELRALKKQVEELRDTTTRYDMSFDTALQRIESRVTQIEQSKTAESVNVQRN